MDNGKFLWKDYHILFIIDRIKPNNFIWGKLTSIDYKNSLQEFVFWTTMVEELNSTFKDDGVFTYNNVVNKWNSLKTYFNAERIKILECNKNGAATGNLEISTWRFYDKLLFLTETSEPMPSVNNYNKQSINELSRHSIKKEIPSNSFDVLPSDFPHIETSDLSPCQPINSRNSSTSISSPSPTNLTRQNRHLSKRIRTASSSKSNRDLSKEVLLDSCLQLSIEIRNLLKSTRVEYSEQPFANYVANDLENLDNDLKNLAKCKINTVLYEISAIQCERNSNKRK